MYPETFLSDKKPFNSMYSVRICVINEFVALLTPSCNFDPFREVASIIGVLILFSGFNSRYFVHLCSYILSPTSRITFLHVLLRIYSGSVITGCISSLFQTSDNKFSFIYTLSALSSPA